MEVRLSSESDIWVSLVKEEDYYRLVLHDTGAELSLTFDEDEWKYLSWLMLSLSNPDG